MRFKPLQREKNEILVLSTDSGDMLADTDADAHGDRH